MKRQKESEIEAGRSNAANAKDGDSTSDKSESADSMHEKRRRFLTRGALAGGSLALGLASRGTSAAEAADKTQDDLVLKLGEHKELASVGGSQIIETRDDKIIVARTEDAKFVACSAVCTHKGCLVQYEHSSKQFVCPCHKSRFALDGQVVNGPAKAPLKRYPTDTAAIVVVAKK